MYGGVLQTFADLKNIAGKVQGFTPSTRLLAILFMRKGQEITDKLITPSLNYFNVRSGKNLHFIMPSWILQRAGRGTDPASVEKWAYSDELFARSCQVIASETRWKYSGDLLLITTRRATKNDIVLEFSGAINIPLHVMINKKLVESPEVLFERLIRFAESYEGPDPLLHLSLQEARVSLFEGVINAILSYISKDMKDRLDYAKHFLIQDVSKETPSGLALVQFP